MTGSLDQATDSHLFEDGDRVYRIPDIPAEEVVSFVARALLKPVLEDWFPRFHNSIRSGDTCEERWRNGRPATADPAARPQRTGQTIASPTYARVDTMYKRKAKKVHPRDDIPSDGSVPEGDPNWRSVAWEEVKEKLQPFRGLEEKLGATPKFSQLTSGSRLTGERLSDILNSASLLNQTEKSLLADILHNRESALAWSFEHCGRVRELVAPPQVLKVVEHKAWQASSIPIPRALHGKVVELLRERLQRGVLEESQGAYRNAWFLVSKKDGGLRLINSATRINKETIRDAFIPPSAEEFSEDFGMCAVLSLLDFFSGYDQVPIDEKSRDLTTFATPIGLLRMCTLPQGATNSVAQFMRVITRILGDLIPEVCRAFLDDITVKGPVNRYDDEECPDIPGVRRFVAEHLLSIDKVLVNLELAGCTVNAKKSNWCQPTCTVVGYVCGTYGRKPEHAKVIKILEWTMCSNTTEVKSFLGIVVYYRIWIPDYAVKSEPLHHLLRKNVKFIWGAEQAAAMKELQKAITSPPILITIRYGPGAGLVILAVDASEKAWGAVLMQETDSQRKPARFESGIWSVSEVKYDATKRECRGVLKAMKRLRNYLYGIHFLLEVDAQVLVHQINGSATDVPGALVIRWLAWIRLFDFDIQHVPGKKHTVADGLSRKPEGPSDLADTTAEGDVDDWVDQQFNSLMAAEEEDFNDHSPDSTSGEREGDVPAQRHGTRDDSQPLRSGYPPLHQEYARFLLTLLLPKHLRNNRHKARLFRTQAFKFRVVEGDLIRRAEPEFDLSEREVVFDRKRQMDLVRSAHETLGHKGVRATYDYIRHRWYWKNSYSDVSNAVKVCPLCQKDSSWRPLEEPRYTQPGFPFEKVHIDTQHMPPCEGKRYLFEARCDLTGYLIARPVRHANARAMSLFIIEEIICRFGMPGRIVVDGGPEFKKDVITLLERHQIPRIQISAYNPQAQGIVEAGHHVLARALKRLGGKWTKVLPFAVLAENSVVRSSTGRTPFELVFGAIPIFPMEVKYGSWRLFDWTLHYPQEDLIARRARMLQRKEEDIVEARKMAAEFRRKRAERLARSTRNSIRPPFECGEKGDLVLVFDTVRALDHSTVAKFKDRWLGPFRVIERLSNGSYRLEDMNGVIHAGTFAPRRLRIFHQDTDGWWVERPQTRPDDCINGDNSNSISDTPAQGDDPPTEKPYTTPRGGRLDEPVSGDGGSNDVAIVSRTLPTNATISLPPRPVHERLEMNEMSNFHVIDLNLRSLRKGGMY